MVPNGVCLQQGRDLLMRHAFEEGELQSLSLQVGKLFQGLLNFLRVLITQQPRRWFAIHQFVFASVG